MTSAARAQATPAQRWLVRLSLVMAGLAVTLVVFARLKSLAGGRRDPAGVTR
jgi:hypothetical protein